ncbi:class I ribonucleotide reductase maintenance protein YfaE [Seminibacterium arietis]|uniref:Class I ribonucleotide reductase maintenance protein YfaE n=1 Tax=Seminibacterium arietis TaxID=1173502 RepID=A0ABW3IA94_9PAST
MKITLLRSNLRFELDNSLSILENLERHGIHHEYQCRSGYCGSCRAKIKKGEISYQEKPLAFLNQDEILLCCSQAIEDLELDL